MVRFFCASVENRLEKVTKGKWKDEIEVPLAEIGFTEDVRNRIRQHKTMRTQIN
jgi:hypothetical protein